MSWRRSHLHGSFLLLGPAPYLQPGEGENKKRIILLERYHPTSLTSVVLSFGLTHTNNDQNLGLKKNKQTKQNPTSYLVDPASSHMLVSKIKPCMSKYN